MEHARSAAPPDRVPAAAKAMDASLEDQLDALTTEYGDGDAGR